MKSIHELGQQDNRIWSKLHGLALREAGKKDPFLKSIFRGGFGLSTLKRVGNDEAIAVAHEYMQRYEKISEVISRRVAKIHHDKHHIGEEDKWWACCRECRQEMERRMHGSTTEVDGEDGVEGRQGCVGEAKGDLQEDAGDCHG